MHDPFRGHHVADACPQLGLTDPNVGFMMVSIATSTFVSGPIPFYSDSQAEAIYSMLLLTKLRLREEKLLPSITRHMALEP